MNWFLYLVIFSPCLLVVCSVAHFWNFSEHYETHPRVRIKLYAVGMFKTIAAYILFMMVGGAIDWLNPAIVHKILLTVAGVYLLVACFVQCMYLAVPRDDERILEKHGRRVAFLWGPFMYYEMVNKVLEKADKNR